MTVLRRAAARAREWGAWLPLLITGGAIVAGIVLRVDDYGSLLLYGDEFHSLELSRQSYGRILRSFDRFGSGVALPLLQRVCLDLFGRDLWAYRLHALVSGLAALVFVYPMARRFVGPPGAAITTLALALSSIHVFYSHYARAYAVAALAAIGLLHALERATRPAGGTRCDYAIVALLAGLLPFIHLTGAALAIAAALGATLRLVGDRRPLRELVRLAGWLGAGGLLCLLLYLPALESVLDFVGRKAAQGDGSFGVLDVGRVLFGSRTAAIVALAALPIFWLAMLHRQGPVAWLPVCAGLVPPLLLLAIRPEGLQLAYARYLLVALPFALLALAWGVVEALPGWLGLGEPGRRAFLLLGAALCGLAFWNGPLGRHHVEDGPHANSNLGLVVIPAANRPPSNPPAIYRRLAALSDDVRIIEAPAIYTAMQILYRQFYLLHRKETWIGFSYPAHAQALEGPVVSLADPGALITSGADYLVFHRDVRPRAPRGGIDQLAPGRSAESRRLEARLHDALGPPIFESDSVVSWRLRGAAKP